MQIYLSDDMIHVTAGLLRRLDHDTLEAVQFGETNGHGAANFFDRLEEALEEAHEKAKARARAVYEQTEADINRFKRYYHD